MEQPKTVYVITQGCYSDYHICAVTLDKDKAERLKKLYSCKYDGTESTDIEEWEIDDLNGDFTEEQAQTEPIKYYNVTIYKYGKSSPIAKYYEEGYAFSENKIKNRDGCISKNSTIDSIRFEVNVVADTEEKAKRIAIDKFWICFSALTGINI